MTPLRFRLREARKEQDLTQLELAEKAGVRQAAISLLESGKATRVDLAMLERLANALGVEPAQLIQRVGKRRK